MRSEMRRIDLAGETVQEVAPSLRTAVDDGEILPPNGMTRAHATPFARDTQAPSSRAEHPSQDARGGLGASNSARDERAIRAPAHHVGRPAASKRPADEQQTERLEEVRLALAVSAGEDVEVSGPANRRARDNYENRQLYPFDLHPGSRSSSKSRFAWAL